LINNFKIISVILVVILHASMVYAINESVPYEMINFLLNNDNYADKVLIVDKSEQAAYFYSILFDPLQLNLINQYQVTTGKNNGDKAKQGDRKTPEGFYIIEGKIPNSRLSAMYGYGAYPINYPNQIDRYLNKKGNGIWLHGTDRPLTPYDTDGCIRFENDDLKELSSEFQYGKTVVIINEVTKWISAEELNNEVKKYQQLLSDWKSAWESQNITAYLQFYYADFYTKNLRMNFERWAKYKERINNKRNNIQIKITNPKLFYSNDHLLLEFKQEYISSNYSDIGVKSMLWEKEGDNWLILREDWDGHAVPIESKIKIDLNKQVPEALEDLSDE